MLRHLTTFVWNGSDPPTHFFRGDAVPFIHISPFSVVSDILRTWLIIFTFLVFFRSSAFLLTNAGIFLAGE